MTLQSITHGQLIQCTDYSSTETISHSYDYCSDVHDVTCPLGHSRCQGAVLCLRLSDHEAELYD